jgi:hypothetical protein
MKKKFVKNYYYFIEFLSNIDNHLYIADITFKPLMEPNFQVLNLKKIESTDIGLIYHFEYFTVFASNEILEANVKLDYPTLLIDDRTMEAYLKISVDFLSFQEIYSRLVLPKICHGLYYYNGHATHSLILDITNISRWQKIFRIFKNVKKGPHLLHFCTILHYYYKYYNLKKEELNDTNLP